MEKYGKDERLRKKGLTRYSCIHCKTCDIKAPDQGTCLSPPSRLYLVRIPLTKNKTSIGKHRKVEKVQNTS